MNRQTAKELLAAYLESSGMEFDPQIQEALELAESDPELQEWMQVQAEVDPRLREAFASTPVPPDLEGALLDIVRKDQTATPARSRRRVLAWGIGMAAALLISTGLFVQLRQNEALIQSVQRSITGTSPDDFADFRDGMAYYIRNVYFQLDHLTTDLGSIEQWLEDQASPVYEDLPQDLTALVPIGCKQLAWKDQEVSLVCFHTPDGKIVHLFILNRGDSDPSGFQDIASVATSHGLETGGWTSGSTVYLLVGSDPDVDIEFALG